MNDSYSLEGTTFGLIFKKIVAEKDNPIRFNYEILVHTVEDDLPVKKLLSFDLIRDYVNHICERGAIRFKMPLGQYVKKLYPFRTNLEVTVKEYELKEQGYEPKEGKKPKVTRYKAIYNQDENLNVAAAGYENLKIEHLDNADFVDVTLQLTDRSAEPLRIITVSGTYNNKTYEDLMRALLNNESIQVLVDGKPSIDGVDIVKPDNTTVNKQTLIPSGMLIRNLPTFFQEQCEGVYSTSIGTFLQTYKEKKYWFVYPLQRFKRFEENDPKIIFYAIPKDRYQDIDRTYKIEGDLTQVLIADDRRYVDQADLNNMNDGNGLRAVDAYPMMHKPAETTGKGPVAQRTHLNSEVTFNDRPDGLNYSPMVDKRITFNRYYEYSQVVARNTGTAEVVWKNCNPEQIYPGMPCKFITMGKTKPIERRGVIQYFHMLTSAEADGFGPSAYRRTMKIIISVEAFDKDETNEKTLK